MSDDSGIVVCSIMQGTQAGFQAQEAFSLEAVDVFVHFVKRSLCKVGFPSVQFGEEIAINKAYRALL